MELLELERTNSINSTESSVLKDNCEGCTSPVCTQHGCQYGNPAKESPAILAETEEGDTSPAAPMLVRCKNVNGCSLSACEKDGYCQDTSSSVAEVTMLSADVNRLETAAPLCAALALQAIA